jgi:hypothetical protein
MSSPLTDVLPTEEVMRRGGTPVVRGEGDSPSEVLIATYGESLGRVQRLFHEKGKGVASSLIFTQLCHILFISINYSVHNSCVQAINGMEKPGRDGNGFADKYF